jgi:excisionase family DNA binding protein
MSVVNNIPYPTLPELPARATKGSSDGSYDPFSAKVRSKQPFPNPLSRDKLSVMPPDECSRRSRTAPPRRSLTIQSQGVDAYSRTPHYEALLTLPEVAVLLRVSRTTVYRLVEGRKIPFLKIGGFIRFTKKDINQCLTSLRIASIT